MVRTLPAITAALTLAILAAYPRLAPAANLNTYTGPSGGNWTTPGNWSLNQVPNSTAFDVLINGLGVKLDAPETINDLSITGPFGIGLTANLMVAGNLNNAGGIGNNTGAVSLTVGGTLTNSNSISMFNSTVGGSSPTSLIINNGTIGLIDASTLVGPVINQNLIKSQFDAGFGGSTQIVGPIDNTGGTIDIKALLAGGDPWGGLDLKGTITGGSITLFALRHAEITNGGIVGSNLSISGATTLTLTSGVINVTAPITLQSAISFGGVIQANPSLVFNSTTPNSQSVGAILQNATNFYGGLVSIGADATLTADQVVSKELSLATNAALILRPHGGNTPATAYLPSGLGSNALVDLGDNKLIVNSTVAKTTLISQLTSQINTGRHGGDWLGKGVSSSTVAADQSATGSHHFTVSLFDNADLGLGTFGGQPAGSQSLFVATALIADANIDSLVNDIDFDAWFNHQLALTPFANRGDYNNDGVVNGKDFDLWYSAAGALAQPLLDSRGLDRAALSAVGGVPEPASALVLTISPWLLARRRRRVSS